MKDHSYPLFLFCLLIAGCGQPGPLYLPTNKPPVYVEPDAEPETNKDAAPKQETKPQPPPQPDIKQPVKDQ
ncbi:lipoprotein [Methyloglobulus sp.]|jgi:predicted small lipoprotein YifL|uniref:LPS translocon maturation chaperone LptM n=1 Tax=Methyloglobulus sp. TaxID=2518622 RepID=UPI0032B741B2